ncbi:MAG TPA: undecaprenyl-diphosphate phosphatase [Candidatus Dormibacteraeota bacterium]|nr:undecaprenyl-diphosphate phosphatase [Candidatus Dormibacteraeota bacterium]
MPLLTYLQAMVIGLLQGVSELFPVSSLGHSVLVPALIGGDWQHLVTESSQDNSEASPYLSFIVALHVATACALLLYFRRDWVRIIRAFVGSLVRMLPSGRWDVRDPDERLAWLIVIATIPVGITGLLLEHVFRTLFAKPLAAAIFLTINGVILLAGERLRRKAEVRTAGVLAARPDTGAAGTAGGTGHRQLRTLAYPEAAIIGLFQTLALLAGISRSGITMVAGLMRGLDHEDAAKFAFLLATPVIFAAGVLKIPALFGSAGADIHGPVIAGSVVAAVAGYVSVAFLTRYFRTRTLTPFGIYCVVGGALCILRFSF